MWFDHARTLPNDVRWRALWRSRWSPTQMTSSLLPFAANSPLSGAYVPIERPEVDLSRVS